MHLLSTCCPPDGLISLEQHGCLQLLCSRACCAALLGIPAGRTTRDSLAYLKRRGHLVHVLISEANAADLLWM